MADAHWTPASEKDVEDIYAWIALHEWRRSTAKKIVRELRRKCDDYSRLFAAGSVLGTARPDLGEEYRVFAHKRWVIVFRPVAEGIEVLRVIDGCRDYARLFN